MANYPTSLPSATPADHAAVRGEVAAIAAELGLSPSSGWATVTSRLDNSSPVRTASTAWSYSPYLSVIASDAWPIINRGYATPFYVPGPRAVTAIAINVTAAGATGNVVRLGLFDSNGIDLGNVRDQGTVAADSTGAKTLTFGSPVTVEGFFYVLAAPQGAGGSNPGSTWMANNTFTLPGLDTSASWGGGASGFGSRYVATSGAFTNGMSIDPEGGAHTPVTLVRWG